MQEKEKLESLKMDRKKVTEVRDVHACMPY
jgi:hypothetical protein